MKGMPLWRTAPGVTLVQAEANVTSGMTQIRFLNPMEALELISGRMAFLSARRRIPSKGS